MRVKVSYEALSLKKFIEYVRSQGELVEIVNQVSPKYDVPRRIYEEQPKPVFFKNVENSRYPIFSNLFGMRKYLYRILGVRNDEEAYNRLIQAFDNPTQLKVVETIPHRSIGDDLFSLPILTFYERDAGPYITSSIVAVYDEETGISNSSIHRILVLSENRAAIRIVPRHLYSIFKKHEKKGKDLDIAILIGAPPITYITSASSPPLGVYEIEVANSVVKGEIKGFEIIRNLVVPVETEFIIRARILANKQVEEGPFVDITGTYDKVRKQPVIEIDEILAIEREPIYYTILPAGFEHRLLMGFPREVQIWDYSRRVTPRVKSVRLTPGGCGWLHAVISIEKQTEGDGKNVILAAFAAHPSLKMVIVVDTDIDIDNPYDVEWALATRMQPHEDIIIIKNVRGSSLDPSADQERYLTSKLGIDATIPLEKYKEDFMKAKIPKTREK